VGRRRGGPVKHERQPPEHLIERAGRIARVPRHLLPLLVDAFRRGGLEAVAALDRRTAELAEVEIRYPTVRLVSWLPDF
jgi:hypothetical protein